MNSLFSPLTLGPLTLANRIVMAPLTRNRAPQGQPGDLMVEYYRQRANPATGAGLIITEASQISPTGQGYLDTPGIHSAEQVAGWRKITDAVHAEGGRIVIQLWHVGRISHRSLLPGGAAPVSSTARVAEGAMTFTAEGFVPTSAPRALDTEEIPALVDSYRQAARHAIDAGFDGVEVHAANGYLIEQFLRDSINDRTDAYGGPIEHRLRLLREVMDAVCGEIGVARTAIRLSPVMQGNAAGLDSDPQALFEAVAAALPAGLLYVHVIEGQTGGPRDNAPFDYAAMRARLPSGTPWMLNNGYDLDLAVRTVADGQADLVAFGRPFIANPDLGWRLKHEKALNELDRATLYGGGATGYTDYPVAAPAR
ncbi:N-ethylmaleimide reductase [Sphaerotilus hippei]|uniref:N-ethylmaleimide reductase n=1 Tax=Sphaerotilus hippei TaxID=744406 RepID=A0A318H426_9BURK|nr:alkene reductase [Sphaerotilus hippei]PXW96596.1 N-ethylmaleimide reductase [Sphaerotilus hippei]